jgi:hypothetical protein
LQDFGVDISSGRLSQAGLEAWMESHGINSPRHWKIITEDAVMGGLLAQGIPANLSIISDDAGQFTVFDHALCWIHAVNRLIALNDDLSTPLMPCVNNSGSFTGI